MGNSRSSPTHIEPLYVPSIPCKHLADLTCQKCGKCCVHPTPDSSSYFEKRPPICNILINDKGTFCTACREFAGPSAATESVMPLLTEPMIKTECPCCHDTLSVCELLDHLPTCRDRVHSCCYCLSSHLEKTCPDKPIMCGICKVWFSKRDMQIHNEELHTPMSRCVMGKCVADKLYTLDEYINHTLDEHSKPSYIPRYEIFDKSISDRVVSTTCRTCRKVFSSRNILFNHIRDDKHGRDLFGI